MKDPLEFQLNLAVVIGINDYYNGIPALGTARQDAEAIAAILQTDYHYQVHLLTENQATAQNLKQWLETDLAEAIKIARPSRLVFYFAGHGIALNGDEGPQGYLIPQDAKLGDVSTYLPMQQVEAALTQLSCRHCLVILDCCFAGAFRWSSTRKLAPITETIHKERYDRFIQDPAWQVITSAASDQFALDNLDLSGDRRIAKNDTNHSPFAAALMAALKGSADAYPPASNGKPAGDGVITATELYLYLRDAVEIPTDAGNQRQTPQIWCLKKHDKGEFIFLPPGHSLNLPPAPPLDASKNPYRGLASYDEEHSELFFGRTELVEKLQSFVKTHPLTVVLGASGSGKSSLVKAGLIPKIRQETTEQWSILPPIRPGETPLQALNNALKEARLPEVAAQNPRQNLVMSIDVWAKNSPNSKLLLFIDQSEEIITHCQEADEIKEFFQQIFTAINAHRDKLRVVLSLRSDFEPQVRDAGLRSISTDYSVENTEESARNTELKNRWQSARFIVPAMTRGELREAIEKPAEARVMYFQPYELVEQLIDEVADMPGALPLISFALSELYLKYLRRQREAENTGITIDRSLTQADYQDLGGVILSLTQRADEEYEALVKENPAYAQIIRQVMLRMVAIGGGELARRKVPLSELEYPPEKNSLVKEVIERFTNARLLVTGEDGEGSVYVEPAHDALVRGWQRLLMWKQDAEESLLLQRRLTPAAQEWKTFKSKEQLSGVQAKAKPLINWVDKRLYAVENLFNKIPDRIARLWQRSQNQQERSSDNNTQFLWNANPYLDVLNKELNSDDNWLSQLEAEFVQESVLQKRQNISWRWRIALTVILGLSGLTIAALISQRNALIGQIEASQQASEANFVSNQQLDALINSLKAAKTLKEWPWYLSWFKADNSLQPQVAKTLRKTVYDIKERNRIQTGGDKVQGIFFNEHNNPLILLKKSNNTKYLLDFSGESKNFILQDENNFCKNTILDGDGKPFAFTGEINQVDDKKKNSFNCELSAVIIPGTDKIKIFNKDGHVINILENHTFLYYDVFFDPNNQQVVTIGAEQSPPLLWNLSKNKLDLKKDTDSKEIPGNVYSASFGFNSDRKLLATGTGDGIIQIFNLNSLEPKSFGAESGMNMPPPLPPQQSSDKLVIKSEIKGHQGRISRILFSSDSKQLITVGGQDGFVRLWNWEAKPLKKFRQLPGQIKSVGFSSSDRQLVTIGKDGFIRLGDLQSNSLREISQMGNKISNVSFSSDGKRLLILGKDRTVQLWDIQGNFLKESERIPKLQEYQRISSFSYGGYRLAIVEKKNAESSWFRFLNLDNYQWDDSLKIPESISSNDETLDIFLNNGRGFIATVYANVSEGIEFDSISIFNENMQKLTDLPIRNSSEPITIVRFSADGSLLAAAGSYGTLYLWDWKAQTLLSKFKAHQGRINSISFSSDNSLLATAGEDSTATLWQIGKFDELIVEGCNWVSDYLNHNPDIAESDRHLCDGISTQN